MVATVVGTETIVINSMERMVAIAATCQSKIYIQSAPNNLNETHTFMCLGRAGRFGHGNKTALKFKYEILIG